MCIRDRAREAAKQDQLRARHRLSKFLLRQGRRAPAGIKVWTQKYPVSYTHLDVYKRQKKLRFTALLHHIYNPETLRKAYCSLKKEAAPGVDGETWRHYGEALEDNLQDLSPRLKRGAYRAKPVRRAYIDKNDGRKRPLGVPALEDKIVQRATVEVLNAIYETDFLDFSYGFRPGRSQHDALDALYTGLLTRKVNWVLDVDIRGFLDSSVHCLSLIHI